MNNIHPTALVHPDAKIGKDVTIGPYSIVEEGVIIGDNTHIDSHAVIKRGTRLGQHNKIHAGVILGDDPQNLKSDMKLETKLEIGDYNTIREHATIHRASTTETVTRVGNHCFLMCYSHIGHDSHVGNSVIIANGSMLAGHVTIEDQVNISGCVAIHQFARIGRLAIIGGVSGISQDVPPFITALGRPAYISGLNTIGLRRANIDQAARTALKRAYKIFFKSGINTHQAILEIEKDEMTAEVKEFVEFIKHSKRGVTRCESKVVIS